MLGFIKLTRTIQCICIVFTTVRISEVELKVISDTGIDLVTLLTATGLLDPVPDRRGPGVGVGEARVLDVRAVVADLGAVAGHGEHAADAEPRAGGGGAEGR